MKNNKLLSGLLLAVMFSQVIPAANFLYQAFWGGSALYFIPAFVFLAGIAAASVARDILCGGC